MAWPLWALAARALAALAGVYALTVLWELGEYVGDRVLTTALIPSQLDSALDFFFGTLGGAGAVALAALMPRRRAG